MLRLAFLLCLAATTAHASEPLRQTAVGCVKGGSFYSVTKEGWVYRYAIANVDLKPFEGKTIAMKGSLLPGDRFILDDGEKPTVKAQTCTATALRGIKRAEVMNLRLASGRAADAGDFGAALELANQAVALLTPADCDTYIDRATVLAQKGALDEARADLALIKAKKKCVVGREKLNYLLLQDLAGELVAKGDKKSAVTALELALAACTTDLCRPDIKKALAEAKKP